MDELKNYLFAKRNLLDVFGIGVPNDDTVIVENSAYNWIVYGGLVFYTINRLTSNIVRQKLFAAEPVLSVDQAKTHTAVSTIKAQFRHIRIFDNSKSAYLTPELETELKKWIA